MHPAKHRNQYPCHRVPSRLVRAMALALAVLFSGHAWPVQLARGEDPVPVAISPEDREFFEKQIRPLLVQRCFECHAGTKAGGGLSLQTANGWRRGGESGPAIIPYAPEQSLLIDAIEYGSREMPPADHGGKLPQEEIDLLKQWVSKGAPDPRDGSDLLGGMTRDQAAGWWAFQPIPDRNNVSVSTGSAPTDDVAAIDAWIDYEIQKHGLQPTSLADRRTLLRRWTYDLTGLPPTQEEVDAFVSDEAPDALDRTIDRLLESPQYGVQWGRRWLDVVRYADTAGENTDRPLPHAWRYRNWVIDAFQSDMPFDRFVRMQIAGDLLAQDPSKTDLASGIIATGYLAIARRFGHDIDNDMHLTHEDIIDNLGKNFLGLTLGCARCHDHKYDPISARDYYALYGIFDSTRFSFPGCEPKGQPRDLVPLLPANEVDAIMQPWRTKVAEVDAEKQRRQTLAKAAIDAMQGTWTASSRSLCKSNVDEGASVSFEQRTQVRRGEILLLTVSPNGNHGADTTLVEWDVRATSAESPRRWSLSDVVRDLLKGNPWRSQDESSWSFLEIAATPVYLRDRRDSNAGSKAIQSWSIGDQPSVFVNSAPESVRLWTTLPANSCFVHPGPGRPVAIAWTSPWDGEVLLTGRVADAHPAGGLDGVSFQLEHLAAPELGTNLADLGNATTGLPDAGPPPVIPVAYAVVDREGKNAKLHERGDPEKLGEEVPRRWLSVFGETAVNQDAGSGRKELAEWVTGHPLLARVMVNRVWEWHFGRGLVRTSNDFGSRGDPPTHPELLDFLAAKFVQSGYRVKTLHRLLLKTAAYRRASAPPSQRDPDNRWLSHFQRRRLTAEELRDSVLFVSGRIDLTPGEAHPFPVEASWSFTQHAPFNASYETNRRSAFLMVQRQRRHPFLALFDGADPNASTPARQTTTVPSQALYFMNDPFFHEQAAVAANRFLTETRDEERLRQAFRILFQREPSATERERFVRFLGSYPGEHADRWSALVRILLASNEFLYVE